MGGCADVHCPVPLVERKKLRQPKRRPGSRRLAPCPVALPPRTLSAMPRPFDDPQVAALLDGPLPADLAAARRVLQAARAQLRARRRAAERQVGLLAAVDAETATVEHDIVIRSSPRLRENQQRVEALRLRTHRARHQADSTMWNITHWSDMVRRRTSANDHCEPEEPDADDDILLLPSVIRMRQMIDHFVEVRRRTDRVGVDG